MTFTIVTLFPQMFDGIFSHSILKRAQTDGLLTIRYINIKDFGIGKHNVVDDTPYGGGVGMVLRVDVIDQAIAAARISNTQEKVILLDPKGKTYSQTSAKAYAQLDHLILVCGHYEGFDERIRSLVDEEISLGDFVLSGGEIAAMAVVESVARLVPCVLKKPDASKLESFSHDTNGLLEHAQYTRPAEYNGMKVPEVLTSGHFGKIDEYRQKDALELTKKRRPDLLNPKP